MNGAPNIGIKFIAFRRLLLHFAPTDAIGMCQWCKDYLEEWNATADRVKKRIHEQWQAPEKKIIYRNLAMALLKRASKLLIADLIQEEVADLNRCFKLAYPDHVIEM